MVKWNLPFGRQAPDIHLCLPVSRQARVSDSFWGFLADTSKIIIAGGSAGGHLTSATLFTDDYNENTDNISINSNDQ